MEVRLVNGFTEYEGTVEVYYNGEWGTVCGYGWGWNIAEVVCRQLGLSPVIRVAYYGSDSDRIWLSHLYCDGSESNIGQCLHEGWALNYGCGHQNDVGVRCANPNGMQFYLN